MHLKIKSILLVSIVIIGGLNFQNRAKAQIGECRTSPLPDGTPAMFCKDDAGNWQQQAGKVNVTPQGGATVPAAQQFFADAIYRGPAVWNIPLRQRPPRNRSLTDVLLNAPQPQTRRQEIFLALALRIEGSKLTGNISGGSWRYPVPISGTRTGTACNITGTLNGQTIVYLGKCDASGFVGTMTQYGTGGEALKGSFQLAAASFVDTSPRDAARAALKAKCDALIYSACLEIDQTKPPG